MVIVIFTIILTMFFYFVWANEIKKDRERKVEKVDSKTARTANKEGEQA